MERLEDLTKAGTTNNSRLTHTHAPSPHFPGKENQIGGGSREGRATEVSLVFLPNCTAREKKGTELKMDC